jgi:hypothetical protein
VLIALIRNPRFAVFGMVACDTIRPGDEFIEFGMETVRFSITYYAVALGLLLVFYKRYRLTSDRFHWAILFLFMSVVNSVLHAPCFGPGLVQIDNYYKMLLQYYLICAFMRNDAHLRELYWAISSSQRGRRAALRLREVLPQRAQLRGRHGRPQRDGDDHGDDRALPVHARAHHEAPCTCGCSRGSGSSRWPSRCSSRLSRGGMLGPRRGRRVSLYRLHHKRWLVVVGVMVALVGLPTCRRRSPRAS